MNTSFKSKSFNIFVGGNPFFTYKDRPKRQVIGANDACLTEIPTSVAEDPTPVAEEPAPEPEAALPAKCTSPAKTRDRRAERQALKALIVKDDAEPSDLWDPNTHVSYWAGGEAVQVNEHCLITTLNLAGKGLKGTISDDFGDAFSEITMLNLKENPDLKGILPASLTKMNLTTLDYSSTGLCAPDSESFADWEKGIGVTTSGLVASGDGCVAPAAEGSN